MSIIYVYYIYYILVIASFILFFVGIKNAVYLQRCYTSKCDDDGKSPKDKKKVDFTLTPKNVRDCKPDDGTPCKAPTKPPFKPPYVCDQVSFPIFKILKQTLFVFVIFQYSKYPI